ncbi:hypothetical protein V2J09_021251 [Rumex salicifolius]
MGKGRNQNPERSANRSGDSIATKRQKLENGFSVKASNFIFSQVVRKGYSIQFEFYTFKI